MKSFIKSLLFSITMLFMVSILSSCEDAHITDNEGTVVKVVTIDHLEHDHSKKYCVTVVIKSDELTYRLFTDQKFTVGDIISFKK